MLNMAVENNLSETAFAVKKGGSYHLRWFTPGGEINLCGHATLACAYVILNFHEKEAAKVVFQTLSGDLAVERHGDLYEMDFPAYELKSVPVTEQMIDAIGATPREAYMGRDLLCVFDDVKIIEHLNPDLSKVHALNGLLLHVTAKGAETDCVSRTFAPKCGVPEDAVCGSGHYTLLGEQIGKRQHHRLSGFQTRWNTLLPHGWSTGKISRKSSLIFHCRNTIKMKRQ